MIPFTVIGSTGLIGAAVVRWLMRAGHEVHVPNRAWLPGETKLGHVIYAAGVTSDFRHRPFETLRANTALLNDVLDRARFDSLLYLSSARIYRHAEHSREDAAILVRPQDPEDLYDLTKLTAEALCHAAESDRVRIVRLTNVLGSNFQAPTFVNELIRDACGTGEIVLRDHGDSTRDYVLLNEVVPLLCAITTRGTSRCYNVGAGQTVTNREMAQVIAATVNASVRGGSDGPLVRGVAPDITRVRAEFGFEPSPVLPAVAAIVRDYLEARSHVHG